MKDVDRESREAEDVEDVEDVEEHRISSEERGTERERQPDRRRFLKTTGALVAGAAAYSVPSIVRAQSGRGVSPSIVIDSVDPLEGAEGELITVSGGGFDSNPLNWNVFVADLGARAHVTAASSTQLVCEIRPAAAVRSGDVAVVPGTGTLLSGETYEIGDGFWTIPEFYEFIASAEEVLAGVGFQLTAASPDTDGAAHDPGGGGKVVATISGGVTVGQTVKVDLHILPYTGRWIEMVFDASTDHAAPAEEVTELIRVAINDKYGPRGVTATRNGAEITITHTSGIFAGFGNVKRE